MNTDVRELPPGITDCACWKSRAEVDEGSAYARVVGSGILVVGIGWASLSVSQSYHVTSGPDRARIGAIRAEFN
jgi:hypothetical protein